MSLFTYRVKLLSKVSRLVIGTVHDKPVPVYGVRCTADSAELLGGGGGSVVTLVGLQSAPGPNSKHWFTTSSFHVLSLFTYRVKLLSKVSRLVIGTVHDKPVPVYGVRCTADSAELLGGGGGGQWSPLWVCNLLRGQTPSTGLRHLPSTTAVFEVSKTVMNNNYN